MKIKRLTEDSLVARLLGRLAGAVIRHKRLMLYPQFLLCGLCIVYTYFCLKINTSRKDHDYRKWYSNGLKQQIEQRDALLFRLFPEFQF